MTATSKRIMGRAHQSMRLAFILTILSALCLAPGCTTRTVTPVGPQRIHATQSAPAASRTNGEDKRTLLDTPLAHPAGEVYTSYILTKFQACGTIPYDNETLPMVSPDGRYIVSQIGIAPTWDTVIASPKSELIGASQVDVFTINGEAGVCDFSVGVEAPVLLGRSCTDEGFLVEMPHEDGSRAIGLAAWATGAVTWLVDDAEAVNAFGAINDRGTLACSSRPIDGDLFDLVIHDGDASWRLPANGGSWLMPTWSGLDDGLFVLRLEGEKLSIVFLHATNSRTALRSMRTQSVLIAGASESTAMQMLNAHIVNAGLAPPTEHRLVFFHPGSRCQSATLWTPPGPPRAMNRHSFYAATDSLDADYVLVTMSDQLIRRHRLRRHDMSRIMAGTQIPRRTTDEQYPFIMLQPVNGVVGVTKVALIDSRDAEAVGAAGE